MNELVEVNLTQVEIPILFAALKAAETHFTDNGMYKACTKVIKLYETLYKQVYTYGQVKED